IGTAPQEQMANVLQQELQAIGFVVKLVPIDGSTSTQRWFAGGEDIGVSGFADRVDPSGTLNNAYLSGPTSRNLGATPQELTDMAAKAQVMPLGSTERANAYKAINKYLAANPIQVPIVNGTFTYGVTNKVINGKAFLPGAGVYGFTGVGIAK